MNARLMASEHNCHISVNLRLNREIHHCQERSCAMTPGLAGFVAAGDDAATWDDVTVGVFAALEQGFTVVPEHGGAPGSARRRTWFDTFDWRLYRAGLILAYESGHRGGELRLSSLASLSSPVGPSSPTSLTRPISRASLS